MEHDDVEALRRGSAAWRLLRADTAPLVLAVLGTVFVEENVRSMPGSALCSRLDDVLWALRPADGGEHPYPRTPQAYVDHWAHPEQGWLRKYYPADGDEPHYDATPAVEQAVRFVTALRARAFVGTESRLNTVFDLLRQLVSGTRTDPAERLADLRARRAQIDAEIAEVEAGRLAVLDAAAQRDRYQQLTATAQDLLADFREVEANFRTLDREMRERITGWDGAKGDLLDEVVRGRDAITSSDQGRSFHAFYDFLLDRRRQEEFAALVAQVQELEALGAGRPDGRADDPAAGADRRLRRVHHDWLDAGERTQATVRTLSEQLRRFLDDQVWLENRRVVDVLRSVEAHALAVTRLEPDPARPAPPGGTVDALAADVVLPTERPLFTPRLAARVDDADVVVGDDDFATTALYDQVHVDPERLARGVRDALAARGARGQVSLAELVADHPLEQGLAELVTYLSLDEPGVAVVHDDDAQDEVTWHGPAAPPLGAPDAEPGDVVRVARLGRVTFARPPSRRGGTTAPPRPPAAVPAAEPAAVPAGEPAPAGTAGTPEETP